MSAGRPRKVFAHRSEERVHEATLELARITRLIKRQQTRRKRLTTAIRENRVRLLRAEEQLNEAIRVDNARVDRERREAE